MKMKRRISIFMIMILIMGILAGCSSDNVSDESPKRLPEISKEEEIKITDPAGNDITIPNEINKIISMAPSITQIIVDLGFGDKLVAVDTNSKDLEGLPKDIPLIDMMAPDAEQIISLNPDLVMASTITMAGGDDPLAQIKEMDITLAYIPSSDSIEGIYNDLIFISQVLKVEDKGKELVSEMKKEIEEISKKSKNVKTKKSIYFEIAAAPNLYSFGKGVFLNEMIEILGAENVLKNEEGWKAVSDEAVVSLNPDVIITNVKYIENPVEEIKSRSGWENINAIKNDEVYYVDNMASSLPNHNIIKALKEMAKFIYPEQN